MINNDMIENDVYSTEEVKTNKIWINGKPVYRICYKTNAITKNVEASISVPANIEDVVLLDGFGITNTNYYIGLNFNNVEFDQYKSFAYYVKEANVIRTKAKFDRVYTLIIFEYTKTTD